MTQTDITAAVSVLKGKVASGMRAALQQQLTPAERLQNVLCSLSSRADQQPGDAASQVQVTVSQTCRAIIYDNNELQMRAMQLLTVQVGRTLGRGYTRTGAVRVTVRKASIQQANVVLSFLSQASFVYQINAAQLVHLLTGQPRLAALELLSHLQGIERASISGIADNQQLPTDPTHIRLLLVMLPSGKVVGEGGE